MTEETLNALIAAVWQAMDEEVDTDSIIDVVHQATRTWAP